MRFIRRFQENGALLFVSHDTSSIINLCNNAIWLSNGVVRRSGIAKEIAEAYLQYTYQEVYGDTVQLESAQTEQEQLNIQPETRKTQDISEDFPKIDPDVRASFFDNLTDSDGWKTGSAEILSAWVEKVDNGSEIVFQGGERIRLVILAVSHQQLDRPILGFVLRDRLGQALFAENTLDFTDTHPIAISPGQRFIGKFVFCLPMLPNGQYSVTIALADGNLENQVQHHWLHDALILSVSSNKRRYGLVGISFEQVTLESCT